MSKLKIGISPCPNDTYIFEAIISKQIDTGIFDFEFIYEDVQTLNEMSACHALDIVKISYANYFEVMSHYQLLRSGGALGKGVGPLLIAKKELDLDLISSFKIGIPGVNTTANFLLHFALPQVQYTLPLLFTDIEKAVLTNQVDAGVIIHENRFTYAEKGLIKLLDLGDFWEAKTKLPIPLGGIAIRREFSEETKFEINQLIKNSIQLANARPKKITPFIQQHAQEMNCDVMQQHIDLYVNEYSIDLGPNGIEAVEKMKNLLLKQPNDLPIFVNL